MQQVLAGSRYLMEQGVIHRDMKPANILRIGTFIFIKETNGKYPILASQSRANTALKIGLMWALPST